MIQKFRSRKRRTDAGKWLWNSTRMHLISHQHWWRRIFPFSKILELHCVFGFMDTELGQPLKALPIWQTCSLVKPAIALFREISWIFFFSSNILKVCTPFFLNSPCPCVKAPMVYLKTCSLWPKFSCSPFLFLLSNTCFGAQNSEHQPWALWTEDLSSP